MKNAKKDSNSRARLTHVITSLGKSAAKPIFGALLLAGLVQHGYSQSYSLTNVWVVTNNTPSTHITTGDNNRGMAYDAISNQVLVVNKGVPTIDVFSSSGSYVGSVDASWTVGGNFKVDQVVVAEDGVIYGGNLQTAPSGTAPFKIYRWSSWNDTNQVTAFSGDPTFGLTLPGKRIGDTLVVSGSGTNTLILAGLNTSSAATTNVVLFRTSDGTNFTPTILSFTNLPAAGSGVAFGLAFYTNNTFLIKPNGSANLYLVQYPTNLAGVQITNGVVLGSTPLAGNYLQLSYNPVAKLLATHGATSTNVSLYSLPSFSSGLTLLATTTISTANANGNQTAGVALGGPGKTNVIYALETNNGLQASQINFTAAAVAPTITTQPVGGTIYTNAPSFTLSVVASGSVPFFYQWQFNSNNISGATNSTYTLNFPPVTNSGYYSVIVSNAGGSTSSVAVLVNVSTPLSSSVVTQLWTVAAGSRSYLGTSDYNTRGIAYDTNTSRVLVSDHGNTTIYVLNANNGNDLFTMNTLGIAGSFFPLNLVGVAGDGVVYAAGLTLDGNNFNIYSWPAAESNAVPAQAYGPNGSIGSTDRIGDSMAVRGAGLTTQILFGSFNSNNVVLFTTTDGATFTPMVINVPGAPNNFAGLGIAFGSSNTFWAKSSGFDLRQVAFDPVAGSASVIQDFAVPAQIATSLGGIGIDTNLNILAGVIFNDNPNDLQLFQLNGTNPPSLFHQAFFATANGNIQANAAVAIKSGRAFALDVNNGIVALSYGVPPPPLSAYSIASVTAQPGPAVVLTWQSVSGHSYQVQYKNSLSDASWINTGSPITATGATTASTNSVIGTNTRFYRILGL